MNNGTKRFLELIDEMREIQKKKNVGYAGQNNPDAWANFRLSTMFGVSPLKGALIRMSDKFIRVRNLLLNPTNEQVGESLKDTLLDLANIA